MDNVAQTPAVPRRPIPKEMWTAIAQAENAHHDKQRAFFLTLRDELIRIGKKHGFNENELERRDIIKAESRAAEYFGKAPPPEPAPPTPYQRDWKATDEWWLE